MMKKLLTIIYGVIIILGISSCSNEQDDIWGESSAQRLNRAVAEYKEILCNAENGWVMEYFANEKEKGYTFLVSFRKTGGITMAAKDNFTNNEYIKDNSLFDVIADNGPVLTFNTYNEILHYFCNPEDLPETEDKENGRGHEGDYEFIVMKANADFVELKGKKRNYKISLKRLPAEQGWEAYLDKLINVKNTLFSSKVPTLSLIASNGEKYTLTNSTSGVFSVVPEGGDPISQTVKVPFIIQENGIRMMKPFTGEKDDFSVQTFMMGEGDVLTSTEEPTCSIAAPALIDFFNDESTWSNSWNLDKTQMGGKFAEVQATIIANCKSKFKEDFDTFRFMYAGRRESRTLYFKSGKYEGYYDLNDNSISDDQITFNFKGTYDKNGEVYLNGIEGFSQFIELLKKAPFKVSSDSRIKPTTLKFTSTANTSDWFIVNIK